MKKPIAPFGRRKDSLFVYEKTDEIFRDGNVEKRTVWKFRLSKNFLTSALIAFAGLCLVVSPDARAFASEVGSVLFEFGRDWLLRGAVD